MRDTQLFSINHLKKLCGQFGLAPSRKYGQNFLINDAPIAKMLEATEIKKSDTVIEIGPGFGGLTFALADRAAKVIAFEIEKKLCPYWDKEIERYGDKIDIKITKIG